MLNNTRLNVRINSVVTGNYNKIEAMNGTVIRCVVYFFPKSWSSHYLLISSCVGSEVDRRRKLIQSGV